MMTMLAEMKYDALGVGDSDVRMGGNAFFTTAQKHKLAVLDASPGAQASAVPYVVKNVGGVRVGIISFGAAQTDAGGSDFDIRKARFATYKTVRDASDVLILLDQSNSATRDWLERNAARLGAPDVVIGGMSRAGLPQAEVIGRTHVVPTGTQGRQVGVVDIEIVRGQDPKVSSHKVVLDQNVPEDEDMARRIKEAISSDPSISSQAPVPGGAVSIPEAMPSSTPYYPSRLCKSCHVKEYDQWASTAHAHAIKTLVDAKRATPECLKCHSEQYLRTDRVTIPNDGIGGVECSSCHMASLPHGMERRNATARTKVDPKSCLTCHTKERSPKYDEKTYFPRVVHGSE